MTPNLQFLTKMCPILYSENTQLNGIMCAIWSFLARYDSTVSPSGSTMLRKKSQRMHTVETLSVGPRQKILLIQVDGQDVLVGVTAHQMTALSPWPGSMAMPTDLSKETPP